MTDIYYQGKKADKVTFTYLGEELMSIEVFLEGEDAPHYLGYFREEH